MLPPPATTEHPTSRSSNESLDRLRAHFAGLPPPIVVFNKSHSGSRLLANLLSSHGLFIGSDLNSSADALSLVPLVEHLVTAYYPDYAPLWSASPWLSRTEDLVLECFGQHLASHDGHSRWGWKLCETTYILPVIAAIFPDARFIHLIRDGRDVAFCNHVAPVQPFWRKVYFNDHRIKEWRGLSLTNRAYDVASHIYNSLHWISSVEVGRSYGAMLHDRCIEVRYEDLCADFVRTSSRILDFCGLRPDEAILQGMGAKVSLASIGKFRARSARKQRQVMRLIEPTLLSLGYVDHARPLGLGTRLRQAWFGLQRPVMRLFKSGRADAR